MGRLTLPQLERHLFGAADVLREVTTSVSALEEGDRKWNPLEYRPVRRLLPDMLDELAELEARVAELDGLLKEAQPTEDASDSEDEAAEEALPGDQVVAAKKELAAAKKKLKEVLKNCCLKSGVHSDLIRWPM